MSRSVVITGMGPVCAFGAGREDLIAGLRDPEPLFQPSSLFDADDAPLVAEVVGVTAEEYLPDAKTYLDRASELALIATQLALVDSRLDMDAVGRDRIGLCLGTAFGGLETMTLFFADCVEKGPRYAKPFLFPHTYANTAASLIAIDHGLTGYHNNISAGAVSSAMALTDAVDQIQMGAADVMLAGGYDALSEALLLGLLHEGACADGEDPELLCRPFAADREGFVPGEGAAVLVLESAEHARQRGATIYAELSEASLSHEAGARPDALLSCANGGFVDDAELRDLQGLDCPVLTPASCVGETFGASTALHVCMALCSIHDGAPLPPAFGVDADALGLSVTPPDAFAAGLRVTARDPGGATACLLVRPAEAGPDELVPDSPT